MKRLRWFVTEDKLNEVELLKQNPENKVLLWVMVLMTHQFKQVIGIAMGGLGSDVAIETTMLSFKQTNLQKW